MSSLPNDRNIDNTTTLPSSHSSTSSIPIPSSSRPRLRRTGSAKSQRLRSHYSSRSEEYPAPEGSPSLTDAAAKVRAQTISWSLKELKFASAPSDYHGRLPGTQRPLSSTSTRSRPSALRETDIIEEMHEAEISPPTAQFDSSLLRPKVHDLSRDRKVSQLSALRQLALSIEQQTAADDAEDLEESRTTERTPLLLQPKHSSRAEDHDVPDVTRAFIAAPEVEEGDLSPLFSPHDEPIVVHEDYGSRSYRRARPSTTESHSVAWKLKHFRPRDILTWSGSVAKVLPAVVLALILNLLDAMSYGVIIFPSGDSHMPNTAIQSGISMFLASTVISQLVYTMGGSAFKGGVGSMMIEVMPFLHIMCYTIESQMEAASDRSLLATIMVAYAMSSIMTGLVFFLLGYFRLGNLIQFFPRHILVGCIGGIGLFLILTGIEVTTGISEGYSIDWLQKIFAPSALKLWGSSFALAVCLKLMQRRIHHPLFVPLFYVCVPIVFYVIVWIAGFPLEELRSQGWLFALPEGAAAPFYEFWRYFDFGQVKWSAIPATIPTQLALTFFGILHVPINVPALAVSTHQDVDLNRELIGHGISNLAAGLAGTIQNYLVYSNSILYIRSGGASVTGGLLLALGTFAVWVAGGKVVGIVPTIVVGALIFHLGIDLMKESIVDTWHTGLHTLEYVTICLIISIMGLVGFTEGIVAGVILACFFFVVMYARKSVIRATYTGSQLRSTVHRLFRQQCFLDQVGDQIHCIKLQGFMFFGTINQLDAYIQKTITSNPRIRFIVLDFSLIYGIDYSALESFHRIKRLLRERQIHLVFAGLAIVGRALVQSGVFAEEVEDDSDLDRGEGFVHAFENVNEALEWCENQLLVTYYEQMAARELKHGRRRESSIEIPKRVHLLAHADEGNLPLGSSMMTPRKEEVAEAAKMVLKEMPSPAHPSLTEFRPVAILLQAFSETDEYDIELLHFCEGRFERVEIKRNTVLWIPGEEARELYVLEEGELVLSIRDDNTHRSGERMKVVETLLPGTMVGELELFCTRPRTCRLVATADSIAWKLTKETFDKMCEENPRLTLKFVTKIALGFDAVRFYNTVYHWAQLK